MTDASNIFMYEATIDELLQKRYQRYQFMETALKNVPELSNLGHGVATDYASLVVTAAKLALGSEETKSFALQYYDTEFPEGRVYAKNRPFKLTLSLAGIVSSSDLSRYTSSFNSINSGPADVAAVRTMNIVIASHPNKEPGVYQGGQNKFFRYPTTDSFTKYDLLGGLIAVRGYYSSIRPSTSRTLLNLTSKCSPFYKSINACKLMQEFRGLVPDDWEALERFLKGLQVETTYMKAPDGTPISKARFIIGLSHKIGHHTGGKTSGNAEMDHGNANEIRFKRSVRPSEAPISVQEYFQIGKLRTANQ